jgi:hypothetical protein
MKKILAMLIASCVLATASDFDPTAVVDRILKKHAGFDRQRVMEELNVDARQQDDETREQEEFHRRQQEEWIVLRNLREEEEEKK